MNVYMPDRFQMSQTFNGTSAQVVTLTLLSGLQGFRHRKDCFRDVIFFKEDNHDMQYFSLTLQGMVSTKSSGVKTA